MKIQVKRRHIRYGQQGKYDACAIALALKESLGTGDIKVGGNTACVNKKGYYLPKEVQEFIRKFDKNKLSVKPFEFTL